VALLVGRPKDLMLEIARGKVSGMSHINKFGRNENIASGATEDIWDGSAAYVFPATALMTKLSQTTDQAAYQGETVRIEGLDANMAAVRQDVIVDDTDSTTPVVLATPLKRVNRMYCLSAVVTDSSIRLHNDAENVNYSVIEPGNNQTLQAIYTVPAGKQAYVTGLYAAILAGGGNPTACDIKLWNTDNANGYAKQLKFVFGIDLDFQAHFQHSFKPYKIFPAQSDIYVTGTTVAATASVSAGFDLILVDE